MILLKQLLSFLFKKFIYIIELLVTVINEGKYDYDNLDQD